MTASGPRLCKDCRHAIPPVRFTSTWECDHPSSLTAPGIDLVTGRTSGGGRMFCVKEARSSLYDGRCGYAALFFEARDTPAGTDAAS